MNVDAFRCVLHLRRRYLLCVEDGLHCTDELDEQLARTPDLAASRHILLLAVAAQALRCWASRGNQSRDPAAPDALAARLAQPLVRVVGELTSTIPSGPTEPEEGPSGLARRAAHYQRLLGVSTDAQLLRVRHVDWDGLRELWYISSWGFPPSR